MISTIPTFFISNVNSAFNNLIHNFTVENVTDMEYSNESDEDETSKSNNISSSQYFPECPVHNHHTDNDSMCPDDPPCLCISEI